MKALALFIAVTLVIMTAIVGWSVQPKIRIGPTTTEVFVAAETSRLAREAREKERLAKDEEARQEKFRRMCAETMIPHNKKLEAWNSEERARMARFATPSWSAEDQEWLKALAPEPQSMFLIGAQLTRFAAILEEATKGLEKIKWPDEK